MEKNYNNFNDKFNTEFFIQNHSVEQIEKISMN